MLAAHVTLAAELERLVPLGQVEWVARKVTAALVAMQGGDGISEAEVAELREMVARWDRLHPQLREFYSTVHTPAVVYTLWRLLTQPYDPEFFDPLLAGKLRQVWESRFGTPMTLNPYPRLR
jgi:hypothetical protein